MVDHTGRWLTIRVVSLARVARLAPGCLKTQVTCGEVLSAPGPWAGRAAELIVHGPLAVWPRATRGRSLWAIAGRKP